MARKKREDSAVEFPDARVLRETDKALQIKLADREESVWIPKSQIHDDSEVWKAGQEGALVVTEWIATEKGLV